MNLSTDPLACPPTVIERIRANAERFAELPAIVDGDRVVTHARLWSRVERLAAGMVGRGLRPGDAVMAWLPNRAEAIEAELAALLGGFVWVAANARFTWNEFAELERDSGARATILDAEHLARVSENDGEARAIASRSILVGGDPHTGNARGLADYEATIAAAEAAFHPPPARGNAVARLRYTSGTTGRPKAAMLTRSVYVASLVNLQRELHPMDENDRVLHVAPLTHASGALMFAALAAGGANVLLRKFEAEETLATIERERITTMFVVPTILQRLVESPAIDRYDLTSLRTIFYGGAPMAREKLLPAIERFGDALVHIFGMTEAPYPITTLKREEHRPDNPKLGSIGKPTSICELRIVREDGSDAADDEVGELYIRGANVMAGYWKDEAETAKALRDGWLASGDLARRDADGYYWIVDRKKDVIISGGFNVYAKEVEAVLCSHPDVAEAAVVGLPHPDWGETVAAFVVGRHSEPASGRRPDLRGGGERIAIDEAALRAWLADRLSDYKRPRIVRFVAELPKNAAGKVLKGELKAGGGA